LIVNQRVVVTGGAGRLGRLAIAELHQHGYDVLAVDRVRPREPQCRFLQVELTDAAEVLDALRGADTVLHLGAIPGPGAQPSAAIFRNNVTSTYHVVEASAAIGLPRLVFASTVFALGWAEEPDQYWPQYVPVDEAHSLTPYEGYGLSKQVGEEICAAASRRTGLATVSLRIMNVAPDGYNGYPWPAPTAAAPLRFVMWPYVDGRDVARACRLALEASTSGHEAFYIAARDTRFDCPTEPLLREVAPPRVEIRHPLEARASVISIDKAKEQLGWEPLHGWEAERP
jgi:nucleoside-diphosphate-sugar epimerase